MSNTRVLPANSNTRTNDAIRLLVDKADKQIQFGVFFLVVFITVAITNNYQYCHAGGMMCRQTYINLVPALLLNINLFVFNILNEQTKINMPVGVLFCLCCWLLSWIVQMFSVLWIFVFASFAKTYWQIVLCFVFCQWLFWNHNVTVFMNLYCALSVAQMKVTAPVTTARRR